MHKIINNTDFIHKIINYRGFYAKKSLIINYFIQKIVNNLGFMHKIFNIKSRIRLRFRCNFCRFFLRNSSQQFFYFSDRPRRIQVLKKFENT